MATEYDEIPNGGKIAILKRQGWMYNILAKVASQIGFLPNTNLNWRTRSLSLCLLDDNFMLFMAFSAPTTLQLVSTGAAIQVN